MHTCVTCPTAYLLCANVKTVGQPGSFSYAKANEQLSATYLCISLISYCLQYMTDTYLIHTDLSLISHCLFIVKDCAEDPF